MKIVAQNGAAVEHKSAVGGERRIGASLGAAPAVLGSDATLASSALEPAKAALAALPEVDGAKVAALREALARGEISFDANRLAGLIQRFHGGRG